jgi:iron(III) transport system substrate-binding protein
VSGAGITRHSSQPELARQLLEWLSQPEAQDMFAGLNREFPVNPEVEPVAEVRAWGSFKADDLHVEEAGRLQADAVMLMDRAGYR